MMSPSSNSDSQFIWMNGKIVPYQDANVHVLSHSLHYGCGVFEGLRAYQTSDGKAALFRAKEHFKRFQESLRVMGYSVPYTIEEYVSISVELIKKNGFGECYVRPLAYINDTVRGLKLPPKPEVLCAIAVWKWGAYMGDEGKLNGVRCKISTYRRSDVSSTMSHAKLSGSYLTSVLARREATLEGYDEAILLDPEGFVAEGSGENLFTVNNNELTTPPEGYILPGITRNSVIQLARDLGMKVSEARITRNQLYIADEVFFTGTAVEVTPIREIDRHIIGAGKAGPVTQKLQSLFQKCVTGQEARYKDWLTPF